MKILFIGSKNSGKSSFLFSIFKNCKCGGIICLPVFKNGIKIGTDAINMLNKDRCIFSRLKSMANFEGIETENYIISYSGIEFCRNALKSAIKSELIIIDEIGYLEMNSKGIYKETKKIMESDKDVIVVIRKEIEKHFLKKFPYNFKKIYFITYCGT